MSDDTDLARPRHALLLCGAAGFVDALGYFDLGRVFTANMTGNTVLLFASAGRAEWYQSLSYLIAVASFTAGALLGSLIKKATAGASIPLLIVASILVGFEFLILDQRSAIALLSFSMGLQGASVSRFSGVGLQTVVLTGALVKLSDALVERVWLKAPSPPPSTTIRLLSLAWLSYGFGAAGAALAPAWTSKPLIIPAIAVLFTAVDLILLRLRANKSRHAPDPCT